MTTLLKVVGVILVCLVLLLVVARITGLEPTAAGRPGLWLKGELITTPVSDWSFTDKVQNIRIQTNTWYLLPHSVTIDCVSYKGRLYLFSFYAAGLTYPHGRSWNEDVARDPHVRIKIGDQLYETINVQTNTRYLLPHSVTTYCVSYNGQFYLTSVYRAGLTYPHGRSWKEDVARDPHVRIKIGDQLYDRTLAPVNDPAEQDAVHDATFKKYPDLKLPPGGTIVLFHVLDN